MVRATTEVVIRQGVRGMAITKPKAPSLALSSVDQEGGEGDGAILRARWTRRRRFITAFSLSDDEEGEGVKSRKETKIGDDGQDIDGQIKAAKRWAL